MKSQSRKALSAAVLAICLVALAACGGGPQNVFTTVDVRQPKLPQLVSAASDDPEGVGNAIVGAAGRASVVAGAGFVSQSSRAGAKTRSAGSFTDKGETRIAIAHDDPADHLDWSLSNVPLVDGTSPPEFKGVKADVVATGWTSLVFQEDVGPKPVSGDADNAKMIEGQRWVHSFVGRTRLPTSSRDWLSGGWWVFVPASGKKSDHNAYQIGSFMSGGDPVAPRSWFTGEAKYSGRALGLGARKVGGGSSAIDFEADVTLTATFGPGSDDDSGVSMRGELTDFRGGRKDFKWNGRLELSPAIVSAADGSFSGSVSGDVLDHTLDGAWGGHLYGVTGGDPSYPAAVAGTLAAQGREVLKGVDGEEQEGDGELRLSGLYYGFHARPASTRVTVFDHLVAPAGRTPAVAQALGDAIRRSNAASNAGESSNALFQSTWPDNDLNLTVSIGSDNQPSIRIDNAPPSDSPNRTPWTLTTDERTADVLARLADSPLGGWNSMLFRQEASFVLTRPGSTTLLVRGDRNAQAFATGVVGATDWLAGGLWTFTPDLSLPSDTPGNQYEVGAFVAGGRPLEIGAEVTGEATYAGSAFGLYSRGSGNTAVVDEFDAAVEIRAQFGSAPTLSGSVTRFRTRGGDWNGSLSLGSATVAEGESGFRGLVNGELNGHEFDGAWSSRFYAVSASDAVSRPGYAAGTFAAEGARAESDDKMGVISTFVAGCRSDCGGGAGS